MIAAAASGGDPEIANKIIEKMMSGNIFFLECGASLTIIKAALIEHNEKKDIPKGLSFRFCMLPFFICQRYKEVKVMEDNVI